MTALGKLVAAATIFFGLIMIALPVGIIANAFGEELHRRDFVVTWSMVAKVPLFSGLDAAEIADIMRLLRAQQVEPGVVIVRRGEPGHSMYFVAAGEVEIELPHDRTRLGVGHFFGEVAVLQRTRRSATATAISRTSLLVLDAHDLRALMDRDRRIAERVHEMARGRLKHDLVTPKGDLVTDEIEDESCPARQDVSGRSGVKDIALRSQPAMSQNRPNRDLSDRPHSVGLLNSVERDVGHGAGPFHQLAA